MILKLKQILMVVIIMAVAMPSFAGWVITEEDDGANSKIYFQDNKIVEFQDGGQKMIFDVSKGTLKMCFDAQQAYWEGTPKEMIQAAIDGMKAAMAQMPEEYKPMIQASITAMEKSQKGDIKLPDVDVKEAGAGPEIAGYKTTWYEIYVNGQLKEKQALAKDVQITSEIDVHKFQKLANQLKSIAGGSDNAEDNYDLSDDVMKIIQKGYPMKTIEYTGGMETTMSTVKSAEKTNISSEIMNVPSGYKKMTTEEMSQMMMQME